MQHTTLQTNISELIGVTTLPPEDQSAFLADIGELILETAFVRLLAVLSDEQKTALEAYLDTKPTADVLLTHLIEHYKQFQLILEETILEFKADAVAVLDNEK